MLIIGIESYVYSGNSTEGTDVPGLATLQERIAEAEENLKVYIYMK